MEFAPRKKEEGMRNKKLTAFYAALMIAFVPTYALCRTKGRMYGKVADAQTGESLPGANVLVEGTSLGAATNLNGRYVIPGVPPGSYAVRVTYVGYRTLKEEMQITSGESLRLDFKLEAVAVKGKTVVVTAQASGQNAAINEELSSTRIMNAVSAARIRQLPDANAAESVGRLPGVYLVRQGGEGTELAVRGLAPQYNEIMIDGVQMAPTSSSERSVNLSMISSSSLSGIELYKTATPDMDAAFLGGVVNFQLREAKQNPEGGPEVGLNVQGSYDNLQNSYNNYKLSGTVGDRFFAKKFGILAQIITQRIDLTSDQFGGSYSMLTKNIGVPNAISLDNFTLTYAPSEQQLLDATVVMDYRLPNGKIDFMNFLSRGLTRTVDRTQSYSIPPVGSNEITYGASYSPDRRDVATNLLELKQDFNLVNIDLKLSHSYSDDNNTGSWSAGLTQSSVGFPVNSSSVDPALVAQDAIGLVQPSNMDFHSIPASSSFNKSNEYSASLDLDRDFTLSDLVSGQLKFGGMYRTTSRYYGYNYGNGVLDASPSFGPGSAIQQVLNEFPWMTKPPYNFTNNSPLNFTAYEDPAFSYGKFLGGNYPMGVPTSLSLMSQTVSTVVNYMLSRGYVLAGAFSPDPYQSGASNYKGNEYRSAGYVMATVHIGPQLTFIPGVRYQDLETSYTGSRYYDASVPNPYPRPLQHTDTTFTEYHGFWLPDAILTYKPLSWFQAKASYTNTLAYPSFSDIIPMIDVFVGSTSVTWNNYALKPAHSQNYDLAFSIYNNTMGLFSVDGFLKQIDNFIFPRTSHISNPALYPGVPASAKAYQISTDVNDPHRVNLWGTEVDWQTHFWYLPSVLSGLVLNVNYTHIFSGAKYPYTITRRGVYPTFQPSYVDTFYTDRLLDQPDDIVNLSVGYDYQGFSAVASMIYQSNVFNGTNFWPELRSYKSSYLRWDAVIKQDLPWYNIQVYMDLNDLNGASDIYVVQANGFPTSQSSYGMTADLGLRWSL